ncbi:hypothetical protein JTB14_038166 [Gonioctena quinquepunctata]|nr:hypothetical protein JTB14_038166 [Gonioctena quinquepunctata]
MIYNTYPKNIIHRNLEKSISSYITEKQELGKKTDEEIQRSKTIQTLIDSRYNLLAKVRFSLKHLQYLSRLLNYANTGLSVRSGVTIMMSKKEIPKPEEDEIDGTKIIPELISRFSKLIANCKEILSGSVMEEGFKMFETMMYERSTTLKVDTVVSEESLIETVFLDTHVLTHVDIKKQSAEIVAANMVTDDIAAMIAPKKKKIMSKK